jgi:hypothetical protein
MEPRPVPNKLATTSLTLAILGWVFYLLQWCFDLTLGLLLVAFTVGSSTLCTTALDFLPFILWLAGIISGHMALGQMKQMGTPGRRWAVWGLVLSYIGMFLTILFIILIIILVSAGVHAGLLDKILPAIPRH